MPSNLSARPTPILLTDRFNLTVPPGAVDFWIPDPTESTIKYAKSDKYAAIVIVLTTLLIAILRIYWAAVAESDLRKLQALHRLSTPLDDRFDLSRILEAGAADEELQDRFDSQGTTLEGSSDSGTQTSVLTNGTSSRYDIRHGLDRYPGYKVQWFRDV